MKDQKLKEKFNQYENLNLQLVRIKLEYREIETLLTNIPENTMPYGQINKIYEPQWRIECTYKTIRQRLQIENYPTYSKIGIKQEVYATFII